MHFLNKLLAFGAVYVMLFFCGKNYTHWGHCANSKKSVSLSIYGADYYIDENLSDKNKILRAIQERTVSLPKKIQLFSHGKSGALFIGEEWKTASQIVAWLHDKYDLAAYSQLNIYGCEFAKGENGKAAVKYLEKTLGICVAASDDLTGLDGDWDLEVGDGMDALVIEDYAFNLQSCSCTEYLYLNDLGLGEVHKFRVNADSSLTEIGSPWMSGFTNPHGLGGDANGAMYISDNTTGPIYQVTCDGGTVANDAVQWNTSVNNGITNIDGYGGYIFVNGDDPTNEVWGNYIGVYNSCDGSLAGKICLNGFGWGDWGMQVLDDGTVLATRSADWGDGASNAIYVFTFDESLFGTCIDPFVSGGYLDNYESMYGITSDGTFLYTVMRNDVTDNSEVYLLKINASDGSLVQAKYEGGWNNEGYNGAMGLVYAPSVGMLYVSGYEDCISIVDPSDLSYVEAGAGGIPAGSVPKTIGIQKECCPSPSDAIYDNVFCASRVGDTIFLQDLISCNGVICEGLWQEGAGNVGMSYEPCNNTIAITADNACGTFTLGSDGAGNNLQCGTFNLTVNIEVLLVDNVTATGDQTICAGDPATALTASTTTAGVSYQWEMSTVSCDDGWTNIDGATADAYTPTGLSQTTYFRAVTALSGSCTTDACVSNSNCITVTVDPSCGSPCFPAIQYTPLFIIKN